MHFEVQPNGVPVPPKPFVDRWLTLAEQKAEAMVAARTGRAVLNPADLDRWLALANALQPPVAGEGAGPGLDARELASAQDPAPGAGAMVAFASAMLLILVVLPACYVGRRDAQRVGQTPSGVQAFVHPPNLAISPPHEPGPPSA